MKYMINVDVEILNGSDNDPDCKSALHENLGQHHDLTVHSLECKSRRGRGAHRPPTRYWDDNDGEGYTLTEVVAKLRQIQREHSDAHFRRCRLCKVEPHLPYWD